MENRNIGHEDQNESAPFQHTAKDRGASTSGIGNDSCDGEELHLLIEFFRLLDRWDRQEVVQ